MNDPKTINGEIIHKIKTENPITNINTSTTNPAIIKTDLMIAPRKRNIILDKKFSTYLPRLNPPL